VSNTVDIIITLEQGRKISEKFNNLYLAFQRSIGNRLRKTLPALIQAMWGPPQAKALYSTGELARSTKVYINVPSEEITVRIGEGLDYAKWAFYPTRKWTKDMLKDGKRYPMQWDHAGGKGRAWKVTQQGKRGRQDIIDAIRKKVLEIVEIEKLVFFGLADHIP